MQNVGGEKHRAAKLIHNRISQFFKNQWLNIRCKHWLSLTG